MRVIPIAFALVLVLLTSTAFSGCIFGCNVYTRTAIWEQGEIELPESGRLIDYEYGELWGGIGKHLTREGHMILIIKGPHSISQKELVAFAEALFESRGWPAPDLDNAEVWAGCDTEF